MTKAQIIEAVEDMEGRPRPARNRRWLMRRSKAKLESWLISVRRNYYDLDNLGRTEHD